MDNDILQYHDGYGNANFSLGPTKSIEDFNRGDLVRYGCGVTALGVLEDRHAGGWYAEQCMGGFTFLGGGYGRCLHVATDEDRRIWKAKAKWREA